MRISDWSSDVCSSDLATADLFPRVSLSGFLGFVAGRGSQIGSSAARAWGVAPSISWAAFDLGSVRARLRGAEADADAALASYEQIGRASCRARVCQYV